MRDSYDLLKNMNNKGQRDLLKYQRKRTIILKDDAYSTSSSSSDLSSSDDDKDTHLNMSDQLKIAILRGMSLTPDQKKKFIDSVRLKNFRSNAGVKAQDVTVPVSPNNISTLPDVEYTKNSKMYNSNVRMLDFPSTDMEMQNPKHKKPPT